MWEIGVIVKKKGVRRDPDPQTSYGAERLNSLRGRDRRNDGDVTVQQALF